MEGFRLPPIQFTEDEANALVTAEHIVSKSKDLSLSDNYSNAVTKIRSVLKYSQIGKADILAERIFYRESHQEKKTSNLLMKIQSAITNLRLLRIEYRSKEESLTTRNIEPFALYSTKGNWLLIAFCRLRNDFRAFRIDQIQKLIPQDENFATHDMTLEKYFKLHIQNTKHP